MNDNNDLWLRGFELIDDLEEKDDIDAVDGNEQARLLTFPDRMRVDVDEVWSTMCFASKNLMAALTHDILLLLRDRIEYRTVADVRTRTNLTERITKRMQSIDENYVYVVNCIEESEFVCKKARFGDNISHKYCEMLGKAYLYLILFKEEEWAWVTGGEDHEDRKKTYTRKEMYKCKSFQLNIKCHNHIYSDIEMTSADAFFFSSSVLLDWTYSTVFCC